MVGYSPEIRREYRRVYGAQWVADKLIRSISDPEIVEERATKFMKDNRMDRKSAIYNIYFRTLGVLREKIYSHEEFNEITEARPGRYVDEGNIYGILHPQIRGRVTYEEFVKTMTKVDKAIKTYKEQIEFDETILLPFLRGKIYPKIREFEIYEGIDFTLDGNMVYKHIEENPKSDLEWGERINMYLGILTALQQLVYWARDPKDKLQRLTKDRTKLLKGFREFAIEYLQRPEHSNEKINKLYF